MFWFGRSVAEDDQARTAHSYNLWNDTAKCVWTIIWFSYFDIFIRAPITPNGTILHDLIPVLEN